MNPQPVLMDYDTLDNYEPHCSKINWCNLGSFTTDKFSVLSLNARSIGCKFSEFISTLKISQCQFTFIIIVETWLKEPTDINLNIEGYKSVSLYREGHRRGGGIKIYYIDNLTVTTNETISGCFDSCESLFITTKVPKIGKLTIGAIYRPPERNIADFCNFLTETLSSINNSQSMVVGDFNINTLDSNDANVQNYINTFYEYYYVNEISLPTYHSPVTNTDTTCLDHMWHNLSSQRSSFVIGPNLSDHYATSVIFDQRIRYNPEKIKYRDFSSQKMETYERELSAIFEQFDPPSGNPHDYARYLLIFLMTTMNAYFPLKTKTLSPKRLMSPWVTPPIVRCIRKKDRWYRLYRRGIITAESYRRCSSRLRSLLRFARREYTRNKLRSLKTDPKKNWRVLNELLGRGSRSASGSFVHNGDNIESPLQISNLFCKYFVEHPRNIHGTIPPSSDDYAYLIEPNLNTMFFSPCTDFEISKTIRHLKKEGHFEDVTRKFLQLSSSYISSILSRFFNMCVQEGVYPDVLKISHITPVHKKGPINIISNYRPIAILGNISKIFESLIFNRLNNFFTSQNILSDSQYGFRKDRNTELAALDLVSRVSHAINDKEIAICVFLDYSACFDTLSREMLLNKLSRYGVRGYFLKFLESYFSFRKQKVRFKDEVSDEMYQNLGVIQGSKLGPLFFDIYSNEFHKLCSGEDILYADDTCLVFVDSELQRLVDRTNEKLALVQTWCNANKLALNHSKSNFMVVSNRVLNNNPIISIESNILVCVQSFKYLGVLFDDNLRFKTHIKSVQTKLSRMCGVSYKLKYNLDFNSAKNMYYACVYSVFSYCIALWGGVMFCTGNCNRIIRLQEKIIKNLFSHLYAPGACLFKILEILKIPDVYKLRVSIYMYRVLKLNECPTLRNILSITYPSHNHNTRNANSLILPFPRVEVVRMSYLYQFNKVWNEIPEVIKSMENLKKFKSALYNYYVSQYE